MDPQLFELLRGFFSLVPPTRLSCPQNISVAELNSFLVNNILLDELFLKYPPSQQYQKRFWKWAIESVEDISRKDSTEEEDCELDSRIYEHYLEIMPLSGPSPGSQPGGMGIPLQEAPPSASYITHFWNLDRRSTMNTSSQRVHLEDYHTVTLLESRTTIEGGTTGLRTWLASFVLAQYLIFHPDVITSKRVLELGSGIGFLGIILASLQHLCRSTRGLETLSNSHLESLWLTDVNDEVLERCRDNLNLSCNLSSLHRNIHFLNLDWSESTDPERSAHFAALIQETIDPEILLGADVVFDPSLIPSLVGTIKLALRRNATFALIALTVRNNATLEQFLTHVEETSLKIEDVDLRFERTWFHQTIENNDFKENVRLFRISI